MLLDLPEPALVRLLHDRQQFFLRRHPLTVHDIGQLDALESVLVQLVEVDREIENPHEHVPLSANGPGGRLRLKAGSDISKAIFRREGVQSVAPLSVEASAFFRTRQVEIVSHIGEADARHLHNHRLGRHAAFFASSAWPPLIA